MSADAQRIAYSAPATLPSSGGAVLTNVAAVFDRTTGKVTKLLPTGTAADVAWLGPIQISDNGRRVMWNRAIPACTSWCSSGSTSSAADPGRNS